MFNITTILLFLIVLVFVCLIVTIFVLVFYSGIFHSVHVEEGSPSIRKSTFLYKYGNGKDDEFDVDAVFCELSSLLPKEKSCLISFGLPNKVVLSSIVIPVV